MSDPSEATPAAPDTASPFRLNLEQQRKRAKDLLRALRAGEAVAAARLRRHHPRKPEPGQTAVAARLSDAQRVIARELGLPSWPRLTRHIAAMECSRARIRQRGPAPDGDMATLHIRCGSDIAPALRQAGFTGGFLEYADPFCQGPVLPGAGWLEARVDFLAHAYGPAIGLSREEIARKHRQAEDRLHAAASGPERVVLWFEHDTYDQLILARCLAAFADRPPPRLELISPGRYPGGARFIGLGQLPPEALRLLWAERKPVSAEALRAGQRVWDALRAPDPRALSALAARGTAGIPQLGRAVRRHCQELPWVRDGLSLTQRLILDLLSEGPRRAAALYHALMLDREPLPWMTDLIFHTILEELRQGSEPVLTGLFDGKDRRWPRETLTITPLGRAVLAGGTDRLSLSPPPRWVGGVLIPGHAPCWRWDEDRSTVLIR